MIFIQREHPCPLSDQQLTQVAKACFDCHDLTMPLTLGILLTDDETIKGINCQHRGIDQATDVLSFPSLNLSPDQLFTGSDAQLAAAWDSEAGACYLGDIIISLPRAQTQAQQYGHSLKREVLYLLIHGVLHLMGYDHIHKNDRRSMRLMEEKVYSMTEKQDTNPEELLSMAKKAREQAYVPYSNYKVGAALLCDDGSVYTGCNIENSSFGLTNCAERTAVFKAISEGRRCFRAIAIAAGATAPWPCGACRQVLTEFAPELSVYITWADDKQEQASLLELLPHSFRDFEEDHHA